MISFENLSAQPAAEKKAEKAEEKLLEKNKPENVSPPKENPEEAYKKAMKNFQDFESVAKKRIDSLKEEMKYVLEGSEKAKVLQKTIDDYYKDLQKLADKCNELLPGGKTVIQKTEELRNDYLNFQKKQKELGKKVPDFTEIVHKTVEELRQQGKIKGFDLLNSLAYNRLINLQDYKPMKSADIEIDGKNFSDIVKEKVLLEKLKYI